MRETGSGAGIDGRGSARRDPVRALLSFAEMGTDGDLPASLRELAKVMDLEQVASAIAALEKLDPSPSQERALKAVLGRWAQLAPSDAFTYVAAMDAPKLRHDAKLWVLKSWGATDPASALAFIHDNPDSSISRSAEYAVFEGLGKGDLNVAMAFLESINENDTRYGSATYSAVREMFMRNDREVIAWASSLAAGEVRDRAIHGLIDQWARYDPLAAKAWMEKNAGGRNLSGAMVELGESWARVDPDSAMRWANTLEAGDKTTGYVKDRIFSRWMQYDFESAAQFLVEQEPSPQLDRAFEMYVEKARYYDPEATIAWAESITDPRRRFNAIARVASVWKSRDRDAFNDYLQTSGLSEKEIKKLQ